MQLKNTLKKEKKRKNRKKPEDKRLEFASQASRSNLHRAWKLSKLVVEFWGERKQGVSPIGPVPPDFWGLWALWHGEYFGLRQPLRFAEHPNPIPKIWKLRFTNIRGPHHRTQSHRHHVLATGCAPHRAGGCSSAHHCQPDPHLRCTRLEREGQGSHRPLRPRRHLCYCFGNTPPPTYLYPIGDMEGSLKSNQF